MHLSIFILLIKRQHVCSDFEILTLSYFPVAYMAVECTGAARALVAHTRAW